MIYCESPTLERWVAPPQEDFPRPTWTRLIADGVLLSNAIEYLDWNANPIETLVCESCWSAGCSRAGLARIVRLADQVLWLPARLRDLNGFASGWLNETNVIQEAVLFPAAAWERLCESCQKVISANNCPPANRDDIGVLWVHEMPKEARVKDPSSIERCLRAALASDPLDLDPAKEVVRNMVRWILEAPVEAVVGHLERAQGCRAAVNTFYFDGYEWPSFAMRMEKGFTFGPEWVYTEGTFA
jgi:hypothetical protein